MARYNLIQIGSIYFTSDGTASGIPCKVNVDGISEAVLTKSGQTIISANGVPWTQVIDVSRKGLVFSFNLDFIDKDVHDDVVTMFQDMVDNLDTEVMNITGDTGNFTFNVKPFLPNAINVSGGFSGNILKGVIYTVITT